MASLEIPISKSFFLADWFSQTCTYTSIIDMMSNSVTKPFIAAPPMKETLITTLVNICSEVRVSNPFYPVIEHILGAVELLFWQVAHFTTGLIGSVVECAMFTGPDAAAGSTTDWGQGFRCGAHVRRFSGDRRRTSCNRKNRGEISPHLLSVFGSCFMS